MIVARSMRLSPHFSVAEFDCHDGTRVPAHAYADLEALCITWLEPLRRAFGAVTIVSGYRTLDYNRTVGGAPNSFHVYRAVRKGAAADVTCRYGSPRAWYELLDGLAVPGLGYYSGHVHADNRAGHARW